MKTKNATKIYDTVKRACGETPFREILLHDKGMIRLYWTTRPGTYGYQVHAIVHKYTEDGNIFVAHSKTDGMGYCKESEAYWRALRFLGIKTREDKDPCSSGIAHKYHIGGNFYKVPKSEIVKYN